MQIHELLPENLLQALPANLRQIEVSRVSVDSRDVGPGTLFIAIRGEKVDGHSFISESLKKGAVLVIGEKDISQQRYFKVDDSRECFAQIAAAFNGHPSREMAMIGVTGTCGKTTTTHLIESILKASQHRVGLIGTNGIRYGNKTLDATHTTPGPLELQKLLVEMKNAGCTAVVMEVSSHALVQHRVTGIDWDVVAFTNLSLEHLDYHKDMEAYFAAKSLLFTTHMVSSEQSGKKPKAVINVGDRYGERLFKLVRNQGRDPLPFSFKTDALTVDARGIRGSLKDVPVQSAMLGEFNAENILCAVGVGRALALPPEGIAKGIRELPSVRGRMETVHLKIESAPQVIVDYAHKPEALTKVLNEVRKIMGGKGRLITVFGCGGDRDRIKRPVMGAIAEELSDQVYVTSDNPRSEDPDAIIREIVGGMKKKNHSIESDRKKAIYQALQESRAGDVVLIAGKGHETGQIIQGTKHPFDDVEVASQFTRSRQTE